jgi:hypothetical protein
MERNRNRTESLDKDAVPTATTDFDDRATPMERFRSLTRRILRVPKEEVKRERDGKSSKR